MSPFTQVHGDHYWESIRSQPRLRGEFNFDLYRLAATAGSLQQAWSLLLLIVALGKLFSLKQNATESVNPFQDYPTAPLFFFNPTEQTLSRTNHPLYRFSAVVSIGRENQSAPRKYKPTSTETTSAAVER